MPKINDEKVLWGTRRPSPFRLPRQSPETGKENRGRILSPGHVHEKTSVISGRYGPRDERSDISSLQPCSVLPPRSGSSRIIFSGRRTGIGLSLLRGRRTLHGRTSRMRRISGAGRTDGFIGTRGRSRGRPLYTGAGCLSLGNRTRRGTGSRTDLMPGRRIIRIGCGTGRRNTTAQKEKTTYDNGQRSHDIPPSRSRDTHSDRTYAACRRREPCCIRCVPSAEFLTHTQPDESMPSRSPVGVMFRRRRPVPAGVIIARSLVMMRRRHHTPGQGKKHAQPCNQTKTLHYKLLFTLSVHDRLNVAVAFKPPSGRFSSVTSPPCMRAMLRAMERPRPVPPVLRLRERSTL